VLLLGLVTLGNLVVQSKRTDMKAKPKTPPKAPQKGIPVAIMVAVGKPKGMPTRGSRTATNMMKKSSRGK
jgi:hypothetical protein